MKLVIEVPDQVFDMVCNTGTYGYYRFNSTRAIKKGIPLDKVIKDIKAEIDDADEYMLDENGLWVFAIYTDKVLQIIDKHIRGADNE